jgi:hypothetical protein
VYYSVTTTNATGSALPGTFVLFVGVIPPVGTAAVVRYRRGHRRDTGEDTTETRTAVDAMGSETTAD